ncbi:RWP-RK domain [Macleaya cordata]|uniref:RWP-RK domain n=1 Tax=Macleaya cordata TaxID=56857 RepID=A0A200PQY7_MACCD|nr:RWP-RK domain [Macleaya cordata]
MESSKSPLLSALAVFRNVLNEELIRSVHVYQFEDGKEKGVEREFMFSPGSYVEVVVSHPLLKLSRIELSKLFEGQVIGLWFCILAFDANNPSVSLSIPSILVISRNPKLRAIPALADDLEKVFHLSCRTENKETSQFGTKGMAEESHSIRVLPMFSQDLNCLPYPNAAPRLLENLQQNGAVVSDTVVKKKKRAATEHIARIDLADLAKYFDLPIAEASRNLKVGLTVLKRKCRELGIPRWPHRKIKSLDTLIHNLQEEAKRQERENKAAAAMAVIKRQRMLEREKEGIERKPFMEIQTETKRFRQDVFKRRHRARVVNRKC